MRHHHRVGAPQLDVGHRVPPRRLGAQILDGHELVEDAVVEHEGEAARRLGLHAHEPLRGRIDLDPRERAGRATPRTRRHTARRPRPRGSAPAGAARAARGSRSRRPPPPRVARDALEQDDEPGRHAREQPESCVDASAAMASRRSSQSAIAAHAGPGEYRPRKPQRQAARHQPGEIADLRPLARADGAPCCRPRNSIGPPISVWPPPARLAARSSASQPPFWCEANASGVTGITLSPAVVPEVFTQSRHRPGHATRLFPGRRALEPRPELPRSPAPAPAPGTPPPSGCPAKPCASPNSVSRAVAVRRRSARSWTPAGSRQISSSWRRRRRLPYQSSTDARAPGRSPHPSELGHRDLAAAPRALEPVGQHVREGRRAAPASGRARTARGARDARPGSGRGSAPPPRAA